MTDPLNDQIRGSFRVTQSFLTMPRGNEPRVLVIGRTSVAKACLRGK